MNGFKLAGGLKFNNTAQYQIFLKGFLDESWSERLSGMDIYNHLEAGQAIAELRGEVRDQAELISILSNIYELHLPIINLKLVDLEPT